MIPISDENPTLRTPVWTIAILATLVLVWVFVQGMGAPAPLISSVCNLGLVAGELTGRAPVGSGIQLAEGWACVVDREPINVLTPVTSMFLHGGWMHLIGNGLFLWVFGNNVEDSMGRLRFPVFYVLCGLAAAATQVAIDPASPVPMVGASGAISGVMGAYLILYPRVHVRMWAGFFLFTVPAWAALLWWIGMQVLSGLPQVTGAAEAETGVAFWAHIGGFVAGAILVKPFENDRLVALRNQLRHRLHPGHP